jgi:hypothetical protein
MLHENGKKLHAACAIGKLEQIWLVFVGRGNNQGSRQTSV